MKILHVVIGLDVGGAELMLKRLVVLHECDPNYNHSVVSLGEDGVVGRQLRQSGVEVDTLGLDSVFTFPGVLIGLVKLIRRRQPDIVQTWMYHSDLIGGLAARIAGCDNVIWGIRNSELFAGRGVSKLTGLIMKLSSILSRVVPQKIVCVAHRAEAVHTKMGYVHKKMVVIPNGFDPELFKPNLKIRRQMRASLCVPPDSLIIGSVGRFNEYKDHHNFVKAAEIVASVDSRAYFLMVGRDIDSENTMLQSWITESGYEERFILMGERTDVPSMFASMDIFCLHSKSEGFPNVLGEAMCAGLPSIVTDVGDAKLLVGDSGLVVPAEDRDALAKGLLEILDMSSTNRSVLGESALKRIKEKYSMSHVKRQYEELYNEVMRR